MTQFATTLGKKVIASEQSVGQFRVGILELNAEKKLNSVDAEMLADVSRHLQAWEIEPKIALIILRAISPKAFCAGGDVKGLILETRERDPETVAREFFTTEYFVDHLIHILSKPTLCIANGITMGGGIGLMNGCKFRVATETSLFAMPELSIGLFPDVGASYFLPRMRHHVGWLMGLTGLRLSGAEAVFFGLADAVVATQNLRKLDAALMQLPWSGAVKSDLRLLAGAVDKFSEAPSDRPTPLIDAVLRSQRELIEISTLPWSQAQPRLAELLAKHACFHEALNVFKRGAPSSLAITHELLRRGVGLSLQECFLQEWSLAINVSLRGDFQEGVRAQLIDKDKAPKWMGELSYEQVLEFFADVKPNELAEKFASRR